jgi:hypothetical protein
VAVALTRVQTKQIRINIHKQNSTKTQYGQYKTQQIQVDILPKHPHIIKPTHTHPHITLQVKTTTVQDILKLNSHNTIKYLQYKVTLICVILLSPKTSP